MPYIACPKYAAGAGGVSAGPIVGYRAVDVSAAVSAAHLAAGGRLATQVEIDAEVAEQAAAAARIAAAKTSQLTEFDARSAEARKLIS